jgi:2-polyprenyl-6-methoxyphenol hydroxylase-like FAD-dependent oxidoreductase
MNEPQILIVGAGPTGLVLAIWLTRLGVPVRIIDKTAEPGTTSRALVVHARTLEFYQQIGLADAAIAAGLPFRAVNLWTRGKHAARIVFGQIGIGISPFPFMLILPQDRHEALLVDHLASLGIEVERRTELLDFTDHDSHVEARLKRPDGTEEVCQAAYIAGCDGAHSIVREKLNPGFPGGTYARIFYVADVEATGPVFNGELHAALDEADFLGVFPMQGEGTGRLIGVVRPQSETTQATLTWNDVSSQVLSRLGLKVSQVNWFSTYHVHHRVATHFRNGRAFLLGDAAHLHSPIGGQGMNTGIGDAVNLSWKLAAVLRGRADARLLDTYEPERIAFARRLVATTDRAFSLVTSNTSLARLVRLRIAPRVVPALLRLNKIRRLAFRTVSQTALNYRGGPLARGSAGAVAGGDRLPWMAPDGQPDAPDNFASQRELAWLVHVYGTPDPVLATLCASRGLTLRAFPWRATASANGLRENTVYLVRPDGYLALANANANSLATYLDEWGLHL